MPDKMQVKKSYDKNWIVCEKNIRARDKNGKHADALSNRALAQLHGEYKIQFKRELLIFSLFIPNAFFSNYFKSRDFHLTCTEQHRPFMVHVRIFCNRFFSKA